MKNICAWCKKELEDNSLPDNNSKYEIPHGICLSCKEYFFSDQTHTLNSFLNKLQEPVLIVNDNGDVLLANDHAQKILKKEVPAENFKIGNFVECAYARMPEGCGNTIHCVACTMRNSINNTFKTGKSLKRVPAVLNHINGHKTDRVDFLISTEKVDDIVLLRIDDIINKKNLYSEIYHNDNQLAESK